MFTVSRKIVTVLVSAVAAAAAGAGVAVAVAGGGEPSSEVVTLVGSESAPGEGAPVEAVTTEPEPVVTSDPASPAPVVTSESVVVKQAAPAPVEEPAEPVSEPVDAQPADTVEPAPDPKQEEPVNEPKTEQPRKPQPGETIPNPSGPEHPPIVVEDLSKAAVPPPPPPVDVEPKLGG